MNFREIGQQMKGTMVNFGRDLEGTPAEITVIE